MSLLLKTLFIRLKFSDRGVLVLNSAISVGTPLLQFVAVSKSESGPIQLLVSAREKDAAKRHLPTKRMTTALLRC